MRATRTRGWGSRGQAMGVDRKTGEVASRKGVFGGQSWGWRLSVAWLEQRTCGGEGWSQRCWSPCPALGRPTPGTFRLGPRGEGGRSGQEAEEKPGSPGNTGHKWVRRDSGQGRWEQVRQGLLCGQGRYTSQNGQLTRQKTQGWGAEHGEPGVHNSRLRERFSPGPWLLGTHVCCVQSCIQTQENPTVTE